MVLRERNFTTVPEEETDDFKLEIAAELEPVFRRAANDNTLSVSVIRLTRSPSGVLQACYVEILLSDQSLPPDISRLILNDSSYESDVRFNSKLPLFNKNSIVILKTLQSYIVQSHISLHFIT